MHRALLCMAVAALSFAAQAPGLRGVFLWDDALLLAQTDLYTSAARWGESLRVPLGVETAYWRPLATTSFLPGALLHGGAPAGWRAEAALIHAGTAAALLLLLLRLTGSRAAAFLGAALWACHPAQIETVTWISARFDLLCGFFSALALLAAGPSVVRLGLTALAVCAAALCKEAAFVLVAVVPLVVAATSPMGASPTGASLRERAARAVRPAAAAVAGIVAALALRLIALETLPSAGPHPFDALLVGRTFAVDAAVVAAPWTVAGPAHWAERPVPATDWTAWAGWAGLVAACALTALAVRRARPGGFLAAAALCAAAPVLQFLPLDLGGGFHTADRFLYLPTMALAACVAVCVPRTRITAGAALALLVSFVAVRIDVLPRWNDAVAWWSWSVERAPKSVMARASLAQAMLSAGDAAGAEREARAVATEDARVLAQVLDVTGRPAEALAALDAAPSLPADGRLLRAEILLRLGRAKDAASEAEAAADALRGAATFGGLHALALAVKAQALAGAGDPAAGAAADAAERAVPRTDGRGRAALAQAWLVLGAHAKAVAAADDAIARGIAAEGMHALAGDALSRTGRHAEAAGRFLLAAAESRTPWAHRDRAACELFDAGDVERAEAMLTDLVAERADDPWPRYHLAVLLSKTGRADGARTHAERALQATSGDTTSGDAPSGDAALRQLVRELLASLTR